MSEKKEKPIQYKFGDNEIGLKDYIHNLENNYSSYVDSRNWSEGQRNEFRQAYESYLGGLKDQLNNNTNRFSTDSAGSIHDSTGQLNNTDQDTSYYNNNGEKISAEDFEALRKRKKKNYNTFAANREVASYMQKIGQALYEKMPKQTEEVSNKFDISKHGFLPSWTNIQNPGGGEFNLDNFVKKDELNPETNTRGTTKRAAYLQGELTNYLNNLDDYDYSDTIFKDADTYKAKLKAAIDGLNDGYNHEDAIALSQLGIDQDFLNKFFITKSDEQAEAPKTELEKQAEAAQKEMEQRKQDLEYQNIIDANEEEKYNLERDNYFKNQPVIASRKSIKAIPSYTETKLYDVLRERYNIPFINKYDFMQKIKDAFLQYNSLDSLGRTAAGKLKWENPNTHEDMTLQHLSNNLNLAAKLDLLTDYATGQSNWYHLPGSENYDDWSYYVYNPKTYEYKKESMLNSEYGRDLAHKRYDKLHKQVTKHQLGGSLLDSYVEEYSKKIKEAETIKKEAKESGKSVKQVKESKRVPADTYFSGSDIARLTAIGADVASIAASFVPVYGTAVSAGTGLTSTAINLGADLADDSVSTGEALKTAGMGLGMDLIGLIPGLGLGAKASKIAKVIKPLAKGLGAYFAANGIIDAKDALGKLTSGEKLTVQDWNNLANGIKGIAFGARSVGSHVAMKRQAKQSVTKTPYYETTTKSGKTVKLTEDQYKRLTKANGLEEQNRILKEAASDEELLSEYIGNKFKRVRKLHSNPPIKKKYDEVESDYLANMRNQDYLPIGYTIKGDKIVPRKFTDQWFYERWNNPNVDDTGFFRGQLNTLKLGPKVDLSQPGVWRNMPIKYYRGKYPALLNGKTDDEAFDIINYWHNGKYKIPKNKLGGSLNLNKVRKYEIGGNTPVTNMPQRTDVKFDNTINWYNDMYNTQAGNNFFNTFQIGDNLDQKIEEFNNLQDSYAKNLATSKYQVGQSGKLSYLEDVKQRQELFNNTGLNENIGNLQKQGRITSSGTSGDTEEGNYADGYFGFQESLRHFGTADSWKGKEDELKVLQDKLSKQGLEYYLDGNVYKLKKVQPVQGVQNFNNLEGPKEPKDPLDLSNLESLKVPESKTDPNDKTEPKDKTSNASGWDTVLGGVKNLFNNPTLTYALPRTLYASKVNRNITNLANKSSRLVNLENPFEVNRYVTGDLNAIQRGQQSYADMMRQASKSMFTDPSLQAAQMLQANVNGIEARNAGLREDDQAMKQSSELAFQQQIQNKQNVHETAERNMAKLIGAQKEEIANEMAYMNKDHTIKDIFMQQLEQEARQKKAKKEALEDSFAENDIQLAVTNNPNDYQANLNENELQAWNQALGGKNPSSMSKEEFNNYLNARKKVEQAKQAQRGSYYGIARSMWANNTNPKSTTNVFTPNISFRGKKGGKLIKAQTKDAERFQKSIMRFIDRNEEVLDRFSKNMSAIIKSLNK